MTRYSRLFGVVAFVAVAAFAGTVAFAKASKSEEVAQKTHLDSVKKMRWNAPDAEAQWEEIVQASERLSLAPRMEGVDETQAEGLLEAFGTRYMPNAYAQYQEARTKALELEQLVKENFPQREESDPTGGTLYGKARKNLALAVARTFRRRDELCFFLLFHQAGIFSEEVLAKYDGRPISICLAPESSEWPDETPEADTALPAEDATFAGKYLPEILAAYQRLCGLFETGTKQYADMRKTALALGAPRARLEHAMLEDRLWRICGALYQIKRDIAASRLEHAIGETSAEKLTAEDQEFAANIRQWEQKMGLKAYVARIAERLFVTLPGGAMMEMVWCTPGTFTMGSPEDEEGRDDDEIQHQVTLTKGFWLAKTEVTQKQWRSVMGNNPSRFKGDNLPVECVSWGDCQSFCKKTGMRLPTEAEWEYACRAGSFGRFAANGWINVGQTHPVGQKEPNGWGLCDMHGNVCEWCADCYGDYPNGGVTDPKGASSGSYRVRRGGSWNGGVDYCRSADRDYNSPSSTISYLGFRPAMDLSAE